MPAAAAIGGGITAGGIASSIIGGRQKTKAAREAAAAAARAAEIAQGKILDYSGRAIAEFEPWTKAGVGATSIIADLNGVNGPEAQAAAYEKFQSDPSFRFQVEQANKGFERSALKAGNIFSGNFGAGLAELNQGLASQGYGNYYNRLFGLSEAGRGAATGKATTLMNTGTALGNIDIGAGTAQMQSIQDVGNARAGMYEGIFKSLSSGAGAFAGMGGFGGASSVPVAGAPSQYTSMNQYAQLPKYTFN